MTESSGPRATLEHLALLVRLGEALHAIPVRPIEEVLPNLPVEPVPHGPPALRGVVFVRGHVIPVLDARRCLGMPEGGRAADPHLVCVRVGGRIVGLEVDEAVDLVEIAPHEVVRAATVGARQGPFVGVVERNGQVIRVLDPEKMTLTDGPP